MASGDRKTDVAADLVPLLEEIQRSMRCDFKTAVNAVIYNCAPSYLAHLQSYSPNAIAPPVPPPKPAIARSSPPPPQEAPPEKGWF